MEDQAPPPYSLVASTLRESSPSSSHVDPRSLTSYLHSHIAALPNRIRQNQHAQDAQQFEADIRILDHLAPVVESFLTDLGARRTVPALAMLTLVPRTAVPADAVLSGIEDMLRRNEVGRVFRVDIQPDGKANGDSKSVGVSSAAKGTSSSRGFTDWGRWEEPGSSSTDPCELLWWKDEGLARRLASYLQPQTKTTVQSSVQIAVERSIPAEKAKKSWGMGWRRSSSRSDDILSPSTAPLPVAPNDRSSRPGTVESGDVAGVIAGGDQLNSEKRAEMNVDAENLAFRRENDFGVWESISGWAIVVKVEVKPE